MDKYIIKLILFASFIFIGIVHGGQSVTVTTNLPLWRDVSGWEENIKERNAKQTIAEIDNAMSAKIVPWQIAVIQGEDWSANNICI